MSESKRVARSIRFRLTVLLLLGIGALLILTGIGTASLVSSWLENQFDRALEAKARALVTLTKQEGTTVELDFADELMPEFAASVRPAYFQIWLDGERILERSRSLGADNDLSRLPGMQPFPRYQDISLADGRAGRQIQIDFVPQQEAAIGPAARERILDPRRPPPNRHSATLIVAVDRAELDAGLLWIQLSFAAISLLLTAAVLGIVRLAIARGLRPLTEVVEQVEALGAESLSKRIHLADAPAELRPLVDRLNDLLGRLEAAFRREQRLSSDIAHELRTPVAELRNLADVATRWPDNREAIRNYFGDISSISLRMERTIANLLALARSEGGIEGIETCEVELESLAAEVWSALADEARRNGLEYRARIDHGLALSTDPEKLRIIIHNLLENAVAYTASGGEITLRGESVDGRPRIQIENPPRSLAEEDLPYLFERFWRKDSARSEERGAGLGLSLVRAFAELLEIEIGAAVEDGILRMTLTFRPEASPRVET